MGLSATIAKAAQGAIKAVGDIPVTATFERVVVGAYDPTTDAQAITKTLVSVKGVLTNEKIIEDGKAVDTNDKRFIVAALDLGFAPSQDSSVVISGARYQIFKIKLVPGNSIYILTLRLT
jgi:hypothetical protein